MKQMFLQIITDTSNIAIVKKSGLTENYWFWIAAVEFGVILFMIAKSFKKQKIPIDRTTEELLNNSKKTNVDMGNLMDNINKSKELYKQLSTKCHPDRFIDTELNKKAGDIFQDITRNQRNYSRLLELKEIAQNELHITI